MSETRHLPEVEVIRLFLIDLLGKAVEVKKSDPVPLPPSGPCAVADYTDSTNSLGAVCLYDLCLAVYAGAALSLLPYKVASESTRVSRLSEVIADNVHEIFNVSSHLLNNDGGSSHLRLRNVYPPGSAIPAALQAQMSAHCARIDINVTIPGYGSGRLTLLGFSSPRC